jgi:hypothetical protein
MGLGPPPRYKRLPPNARRQNFGQPRFKQELVLGQHPFKSRPNWLRTGANYKRNLGQTQITNSTITFSPRHPTFRAKCCLFGRQGILLKPKFIWGSSFFPLSLSLLNSLGPKTRKSYQLWGFFVDKIVLGPIILIEIGFNYLGEVMIFGHTFIPTIVFNLSLISIYQKFNFIFERRKS